MKPDDKAHDKMVDEWMKEAEFRKEHDAVELDEDADDELVTEVLTTPISPKWEHLTYENRMIVNALIDTLVKSQ